jgi:hypothetical protein
MFFFCSPKFYCDLYYSRIHGFDCVGEGDRNTFDEEERPGRHAGKVAQDSSMR